MARGGTIIRLLAVASALAPVGCTGGKQLWTRETKDARRPAAEITQASHTDLPGSPVQHEGLSKAEEAYRHEDFAKAGAMFEEIADDTKNRPEVAERARFYQAECLRRQNYYPKAVDAYHKLLQDFPAGLYREQAVGQMYQIASEWLQPVRDEIAELSKPEKERKQKPWTDNLVLVNFDRKLPTVGSEDRALQTLERVYFNDPTGPYADKALFMLGRVHYHRENYKDAARYFQQLAENYDRSPLRDEALKLAIIAKNNSSGGPQYDGRDTTEAMRLINNAKATSPVLARENGKLLDEQALMVRYQQAMKDFETAEFYRRTGHPGSAWFYYELVQRRYGGIKPFAEQAKARQSELKIELDEMKNPSTMATTRRIWKEYVLGHQLPAVKDKPGGPEIKDLPEPRPETLPASATAVPAELRPR
ncbi:MAG TPA: tetratricopeptide repeat protein [Gemmataceae bacterium]|nr:tetratricopeptide repeat protein [Gemmataceae bacterium]